MEFCFTRKVGTLSVLTHFKIFITKMCMKVPGILAQKNLEFLIENLEFGIWKKSGNPVNSILATTFSRT